MAAPGGVVAFAVGVPALRLRGLYLAVTTFAFGLATEQWLLSDRFFGWFPKGDSRFERPPLFGQIRIDTPVRYYMYSLIVLALVFLAARGIRRSRTGRVIIAVRENERAAQSYSIPRSRAKLTAFVISGVLAGIGGALFAHLNQSFSVTSYSTGESFSVFTSAVIGGLGSLGGGVLGAVYLRGIRWFITVAGMAVAVERRRCVAGAADPAGRARRPVGHAARRVVRLLVRHSTRSVGRGAGRRRPWSLQRDAQVLSAACRHPGEWLRDICGGEAAFPLVVLFGLNAVDELDRTAFAILLPNIRDEFDLDNTKVLGLVALVSVAALALQVPIAQYADRTRRVPLAIAGAVVWALFSGLTGLATGVIVLSIARSGSAIGKAVIDPTHNSLIADYYPINSRSRVFSTHRAANAVGAFVGPLSAGLLAYAFGWRAPFLVFVIPTMVFAVIALRLREPVRGRWERQAMGASDEVIATEETVPSFAESWRTVQKIESLRRIWWSLPFLATALIGFVALASLLYEQEFGLDDRARGFAVRDRRTVPARRPRRRLAHRHPTLPQRHARPDPVPRQGRRRHLDRRDRVRAAPNIVVAVAVNSVISASLAMLGPGILVALSLAIPPRARATGFSVASLWVIPGLVVLPIIGWISGHVGIRWGMLVLVPLFIIGSLILGSAGSVIDADIAQVWRAAAARSEALYQRRQGQSDLLLVRGVDAGYDGRQVLFGVDIDIKEGEIVALLGTNGAGKSTLLKAISGVVEADRGAVVLDGRDITHAPPNEIAALGISQMPGGQGVFGSLTVGENLRLAGWTRRRHHDVDAAIEEVLTMFPVLRERLARLGSRPQRRPATDARARHGVHRQAAGAADRRAVVGPRACGRRPAAAPRAPARR